MTSTAQVVPRPDDVRRVIRRLTQELSLARRMLDVAVRHEQLERDAAAATVRPLIAAAAIIHPGRN